MTYGYIASIKTQPGSREEVVSILLSGVEVSARRDVTSTLSACPTTMT